MSILRILLEITVYSALLMALILLLKRLFKKQFSPSLQYFIWFLLIARLAIPFTVQSSFGLVTIPQEAVPAAAQAEETAEAPAAPREEPAAVRQQAQAPVSINAKEAGMGNSVTADPGNLPGTADPTLSAGDTSPAGPAIKPETVFLAVWLAGIAAVALKTAGGCLSLSRRIRRSCVLPPADVMRTINKVRRELGIRRRLRVLVQNSASSPALTASFLPKLILPISLLGHPARLHFAVRHELVHFKRGDYIVCLLMLMLRAVYWFNPVVWLMQKPIKTDMEAACDNIATAALPPEAKKAYARTILEMFSCRMCPQPVLGMSLQNNKKTAEKRIRGIFMKSNTKRGIRFISVFAAVLLVAVCFTTACQPSLEVYSGITDRDKFAKGTSVAGIAMGGLTFEEGKRALQPVVDDFLSRQVEYTVKNIETPYRHLLSELGVWMDAEAALAHAMKNGGEEKNFPMELTVDDARIKAAIAEDSADWNQPEASYSVEKEADEDALTTSGRIVRNEPGTFFRVDEDALLEQIRKQIENQDLRSFAAPGKTETAVPVAGRELVLMGSATTAVGRGSSESRKYNIWKISNILNGAIIHPGETFSINDTVGDRTVENGWALAPGIENGTYTQQAGGGICQVSSTMYNAALRAEMKIVERVPHTIMASYVPQGMDATISTGGPDFRIGNPYDCDIILIVNCDIPSSQVTVDFYGQVPRNYSLLFESVLDSEEPLPDVQYKTNSSLDKYAVKLTKVGQPGEQYTVYAQKYGKETDQPIGEKYKVTTSTYSATAPVVEVGSGIPLPADGTPLEDVMAQAAELQAAKEAADQVPSPALPTPVLPDGSAPAA